jgi:polyisoprenoid-binding protein YceI
MKALFAIAVAAATTASLAFTPAASFKPATYKLDTKASNIVWTGKKVTGQHNGTISFNKGNVLVDKGILTGGSFEANMKSITNKDIEDAETKGKLLGHLNSDDFFGTEKHPTSTLTITSAKKTGAESYDITGNLVIKGISKPVTFPATVKVAGNKVTAVGTVKVNRTAYDIKYGSGSFFSDLGDKAIYDEFDMEFNIVAAK